MGGWDVDASLGYGYNKMMFTIKNTLNRSLGPTSPTQFNAGGFDYDQLVFNLSGVRGVEVSGLASPLNVAVGLEARTESYSITAGEPDSYRNGGSLIALGTPGCTTPSAADTAAGGCPAPSGAQVFPGFRPANVVDKSRNAIGAYIDLEANLTEKLLGSVAIRAEDYSDFGSNLSGKVSARYDFIDGFAMRASYSTGFRAPSLQQQYFATTSTNFIGGVPFDITTFPATDPVAVALGAKPLDSEDSTNFSIGAVFQFDRASLTVDAYRIKIDNRIVLSENLTSTAVRNYLTSQGFIGIGGGRFFINGVDTVTKVTKVPATPQLSALSPAPILFDRGNILTFEQGTPKDKYALSVAWTYGDFGVTARGTRYGDVLSPQNVPTVTAPDFLLSAKTLVDLEARYSIGESVKLAVGADNLLDEYPDPLPPGLNTTGAASYSNLSPFGRSGRYVYGRVTFSF